MKRGGSGSGDGGISRWIRGQEEYHEDDGGTPAAADVHHNPGTGRPQGRIDSSLPLALEDFDLNNK